MQTIHLFILALSMFLAADCTTDAFLGATSSVAETGEEQPEDLPDTSQATDSGVEPNYGQVSGLPEGSDLDQLRSSPRQGAPKPSDNSEDIGYVKPELRDNGDLFFRTEGLAPGIEAEGLLLAGSYPTDIRVFVEKAADTDVAQFKAEHIPIALRLENSIGGVLSAGQITQPYRFTLVSSLGITGLALTIKTDSSPKMLPTPTDGSSFTIFTQETSFSAWLTSDSSTFYALNGIQLRFSTTSVPPLLMLTTSEQFFDYVVFFFYRESYSLESGCSGSGSFAHSVSLQSQRSFSNIGSVDISGVPESLKSFDAIVCGMVEGFLTGARSKLFSLER